MHDIGPSNGSALRAADLVVAGGDGPPWFEVTVENFPVTYSCLQAVSHDAGFGANHDSFSVSQRWTEKLPKIEAALAALSEDRRETFCIGDMDTASSIKAAAGGALDDADDLLSDFSED